MNYGQLIALLQGVFVSLEEVFLEVGQRIGELRGKLTQAVFAELLGVDRKTVVGWETGKRLPDGSSLLKLTTEFGADVNYILTGKKDQGSLAKDAAENVLLSSYRRCNPEAQANLIQMAALLAAGLGAQSQPGAGGVVQNIDSPVFGGVAGRNIIHKAGPKK